MPHLSFRLLSNHPPIVIFHSLLTAHNSPVSNRHSLSIVFPTCRFADLTTRQKIGLGRNLALPIFGSAGASPSQWQFEVGGRTSQ